MDDTSRKVDTWKFYAWSTPNTVHTFAIYCKCYYIGMLVGPPHPWGGTSLPVPKGWDGKLRFIIHTQHQATSQTYGPSSSPASTCDTSASAACAMVNAFGEYFPYTSVPATSSWVLVDAMTDHQTHQRVRQYKSYPATHGGVPARRKAPPPQGLPNSPRKMPANTCWVTGLFHLYLGF